MYRETKIKNDRVSRRYILPCNVRDPFPRTCALSILNSSSRLSSFPRLRCAHETSHGQSPTTPHDKDRATDPGEVLTRFTQSPVSRIRKFMITDLWSLRLLQLSTLFNSISLSWNCYFSNLLNQFFPFDCASPRHLEAWGIFWKKSKNLFVNFFNVYVRFVDLNLSRKKIIIMFYHCIA